MITINLLGIDPGTTKSNPLGWAVVKDDEELIDYGYFATKEKGVKRLFYIADQLQNVIKNHEIDLFVIEGQYGPNRKSLKTVNTVIGVVYYILYLHDIECYDSYTPNHIKKIATGSGKAKKEDMINHIKEKYSLTEDEVSKDEADAICIALTGIEHYNKEN